MNIGFIGLGNMGFWMAHNLQKAGHDLHVNDLDSARAQRLLDLGASWAPNLSLLAQQSEIVFTSLPGPPQVERVLLGENGLLAAMQPGQTWIDLTTNSPELVARIAALGAERGIHTLEAPVTGAVDGAREGRLSLFVGGDPAVYEAMQPNFRPMGRTLHTGPIGTGNIAKLVTNLLWFIHAVAIGEGLVLGVRAGIDLENLWEIIKSSAGNSWVAEHDVPSIFAGHYDPTFSLDLCLKDLGLTMEAGKKMGVPLELGGLVEQIFERARDQFGGAAGELHVVKLLEEATGVPLQVPGY
jgi:3-hydroxyisobutyrate dehydrogenase